MGHPRTGEAGFTLIELMIVVIILGILAAITLPYFPPWWQPTRMAATVENLNTVSNAALVDSLFGGVDATPLLDGDQLDFAATLPFQLTAQEVNGAFQLEVPERDGWGHLIEYRVDQRPNATVFGARSPNADGVFSNAPYVVGTRMSPDDKTTDLVRLHYRWVSKCDPALRNALIIPPPPTIQPPIFGQP